MSWFIRLPSRLAVLVTLLLGAHVEAEVCSQVQLTAVQQYLSCVVLAVT